MKTNALAVANYLIELARRDNIELHLLGLVKRVYIAHGFSLALYYRSLLDDRFDKVEAWRYGPVIPSVYHSFKQFRNAPITDFAQNLRWDERRNKEEWYTPMVADAQDKAVIEAVWKRYENMKDSKIVDLLHMKGTPWSLCYEEGKNKPIPDELTGAYYQKLVANIVKNHGR